MDQHTVDNTDSIYITDDMFLSNASRPQSREDVKSSIDEFAKRWSPKLQASTSNMNPIHLNGLNNTRTNTISSSLNNSWNPTYSEPPNREVTNDVTLNSLSIEIDPHAWDLPSENIKINLKRE